MEFQEILAEGPIKIERLATKPADSADNEGRIIYVRDEEKIYYGTATVWYEISSGASSSLAAHMADTTTHGSTGDIAGDTDVTNAITAHGISPSAHPLATTSAPGFLKTLSNNSLHYLNGLGNWVSAQSSATNKTVTQTAHGFTVGNAVRLNGALYVKAIATSAENAEVIGIVSVVNSSSSFDLTLTGYISGLSGLTAGSIYFLSDATAGALSLLEPSTVGYVSKPLLLATSTTEGYFFNWRGSIIAAAAVGVLTGEAGTKAIFYQDTAPNGWTIENTLDDKLVYITKGHAAGGQTGGTVHSTGSWSNTTDGHLLTPAESGLPAHSHVMSPNGWAAEHMSRDDLPYYLWRQSGGSPISTSNCTAQNALSMHTHGMSGWRPSAYNCIICVKS